eukprot:scaffold135279_cov45-Prasinocladus_malaysianus.AAC.1
MPILHYMTIWTTLVWGEDLKASSLPRVRYLAVEAQDYALALLGQRVCGGSWVELSTACCVLIAARQNDICLTLHDLASTLQVELKVIACQYQAVKAWLEIKVRWPIHRDMSSIVPPVSSSSMIIKAGHHLKALSDSAANLVGGVGKHPA